MAAPLRGPPYCLPSQPQSPYSSSMYSANTSAIVYPGDGIGGLSTPTSINASTSSADRQDERLSAFPRPTSSSSIPAHSQSSSPDSPHLSSPSSVSSSSTLLTAEGPHSPTTLRVSSFPLPIPPPTPPRSPLLSLPSSSSSMCSSTSPLNKRSQSGSRTRDKSGWAATEDPDLAAARRALWDDDIPDVGDNDGSRLKGKNESTKSLSVELQNLGIGSSTTGGMIERESNSDPDSAEPESSFPISNCPHQPAHTTLVPQSSCLRRNSSHSSSSSSCSPSSSSSFLATDCGVASSSEHPPPTSLSDSAWDHQNRSSPSTSLSSSSISVQFSSAPPLEFLTHSPTEYERKGEAPVEKLTIREWVELRDVREAVGVWSGRIAKWEGDGTSGATADSLSLDGQDLSASHRKAAASIANKEEQRESAERSLTKKSSYGSLAAVVGVVTVGNNSGYNASGRASYPNLEPPPSSV